jgi:hypothetical protein
VFQPIAPSHGFKFAFDGICYRNQRAHLEFKGGEDRAEFVNFNRIVAVHEQMAAPFAYSHDEQFDLEVGGRLPDSIPRIRLNLPQRSKGCIQKLIYEKKKSSRTLQVKENV